MTTIDKLKPNLSHQYLKKALVVTSKIIVPYLLRFEQINGTYRCPYYGRPPPIEQHGFIPGRSTCANLLEAFNDWTSIMENKYGIAVANIDF